MLHSSCVDDDAALPAVQYDLDDNGRLDAAEFKKMLQALGAGVSDDEAEAAMQVRRPVFGCCGLMNSIQDDKITQFRIVPMLLVTRICCHTTQNCCYDPAARSS
jgi:hypothetical protein